jgi:hypothetical protein
MKCRCACGSLFSGAKLWRRGLPERSLRAHRATWRSAEKTMDTVPVCCLVCASPLRRWKGGRLASSPSISILILPKNRRPPCPHSTRHSKVRLKADSGTFLQKVTVEEDRKSRAYADLCVFTGGVGNPAKGVKRPRLDSQEGKTPTIGDHQARSLLDAPDPTTLQELRDRAILAT